MRIFLTMSAILVFAHLVQAQDRPSLQQAFSSSGVTLKKVSYPTLQLTNSHAHLHHGVQVTPLFCRMENKWEKKAGHGVRFRLGDVRTVNQYEGKANPLSIDR